MEESSSLNKPKSKKKTPHRSSLTSITLFFILFIFLFLSLSYKLIPISLSPSSGKTLALNFPLCGKHPFGDEKFLIYAPHSGFSNQLSEFKNAIFMAGIFNRTLIVPPILDHHAVALGSCPKFRVLSPNDLRLSVWDHAIELIRSRRYVSMNDIIDISSLVSTSVLRTVDYRDFLFQWCGMNTNLRCLKESEDESSLFSRLKQCRSLLSGLDGNVDNCVYALQQDCRTTVWTYQQNHEDGALDSFQPDDKILKKQKVSYVRKRLDVYKTLGPGSEAGMATVLAFGSLFTGPYGGSESYIDIHDSVRDRRIQSLIDKSRFLPFVPEITRAGKEFAYDTIKAPFLCAQLRLVDGQFKNHREATFLALTQKVESLRKKGPLPVHIFVMTDLPEKNWSGSYLGILARDFKSFKLHSLRNGEDLVTRTAKKVLVASHELDSSRINHCSSQILPDILLYVEETVCSCASLGFVETVGSTIADSIQLMRKNGVCLSENSG